MSRMFIRGMALDKLLIAVMAVSVLSTAVWNYQVRNSESWADPMLDGKSDVRIKNALDDIKYHLKLTRYQNGTGSDAIMVKEVNGSDIIGLNHNGINVEYHIDENKNLIRRMDSVDKILAENISSLQLLEVGRNTMFVTLTRTPFSQEREDEIETMSKSYSVVIEMNGLL